MKAADPLPCKLVELLRHKPQMSVRKAVLSGGPDVGRPNPRPLCSTGLLSVLCVCGVYLGHHLPPLHPSAVAVLRCQHLRVGAVCVAHR